LELFDTVLPDGLFDSTLMDRDVQAYVGDTSVVDGEPINQRVTDERDRIRREYGEDPHPTPLCGPVILLGLDRGSGGEVDLPTPWLEALLHGGRLGWLEPGADWSDSDDQ
jgi:hypothetical protein